MPEPDHLQQRYPKLSEALPRVALASLPTSASEVTITTGDASPIWLKNDEGSASCYGGNKVRKLEYLFGRIAKTGKRVIGTFGTVASNHALAVAIHASALGYTPVCFLAHQTRTPLAADALRCHSCIGSEVIPWGRDYAGRLRVLRRHLWHRDAAVIPMGGSSWCGSAGFVNAALELLAQVDAGVLPQPQRVYIATGTMGSAAGLALGFAMAGREIEVHGVRVSPVSICNEASLRRLMKKMTSMLHRIDPTIPPDLYRQSRLVLREEFFGPGYARTTPATERAIDIAGAQAGLALEATYTGKAMAAVLADLPECRKKGVRQLFWNTYNSMPLPTRDTARTPIPPEFMTYLD